MKDHVKVIGVLWIILGALCLCLAFFAFLVFFGVAQIPNVDIEPGILRLIGIIASSFLGLIGLPQIIGGLGLIQHKEWARILILIVSFILSMINNLPSLACSRAFAIISRDIPPIFVSSWNAVIPFFVPVTLKSISP